jgi:hypothetical protein
VLPVLNLGLVLPLLSLQPLGHRVDELGIVAAKNDKSKIKMQLLNTIRISFSTTFERYF